MRPSDSTHSGSPSVTARRLERIAWDFEAALRRGERPAIEDHLPDTEELRRAVLVELIHGELELRLKAGEPVRIEGYLERFPELRGDTEDLLSLIAAEYVCRKPREQELTPVEYQQRFPDLAAQLSNHLQKVGSGSETAALPGTRPPTEGPGRWPNVAGYEILDILGKGGMGVVYRARHLRLDRLVALKMIRAADTDDEYRERFQLEARAVARLRHPHIVQVYEVGEADGRPFLALEYLEGGSLDARLNGTPLPPRASAQLVETVARAMHHAHQQGIVHRDLKPANILLQGTEDRGQRTEDRGQRTEDRDPQRTERDGPAVPSILSSLSAALDPPSSVLIPKITDFGLAKRLDDASGQTTPGAIMGTPAYMAPEQARGDSRTVGPAADIYALGALLYECLTGRPPFKSATAHQTLEQVLTQEPVAPGQLQPQVPRDLDTICLKCLEKEAPRRYASAEDLADDLRRFLAGEPIRARPTPAWERLAKWSRRRPAVAALSAAVALTLAVALPVVTVLWINTQLARDSERLAHDGENAAHVAESQAQEAALRRERDAQLAEQRRALTAREARADLYSRGVAHAEEESALGHGERAEQILDACAWDLRDWEWQYTRGLGERSLRTLRGHVNGVSSVSYSPDGQRLATGSLYRTKVWGPASGRPVLDIAEEGSRLSFTPDGQHLVVAQNLVKLDQPRKLKVLEAADGKEVRSFPGPRGMIHSLAVSNDSRLVATGGGDLSKPTAPGEVHVYEIATGKEIFASHAHTKCAWSVALNADGTRLASASSDGTARIWSLPEGRELLSFRGHAASGYADVLSVAFSPNGRQIASGGAGEVRIWEADTGREVALLKGHVSWVRNLAFSSDGTRLATSSDDHTARVWDLKTGRELLTLRGHTAAVLGLAFRPDGAQVATGSDDLTARIWDAVVAPEGLVLRGYDLPPRALAFNPEGTRLATVTGDSTYFPERRDVPGEVRITDPATARDILRLGGQRGPARTVTFSPDGKQLAYALGSVQRTSPDGKGTVTLPGAVKVLDAATGQEQYTLSAHRHDVSACAYSPDGAWLVSAGGRERSAEPGELLLWDARSGRLLRWLDGAPAWVEQTRALGYLASVGATGPLAAAAALAPGHPSGHRGVILSVAFGPGGRLATGGADGLVKLWEVNTGAVLLTCRARAPRVDALAFSPDGHYLAAGGRLSFGDPPPGAPVQIWDAASGAEVQSLDAHTAGTFALAFSSDSKHLASAGHHNLTLPDNHWESWGEVKLWEPDTGRQILLVKTTQIATAVAFSPDGKRLTTTNQPKQGLGSFGQVWDAQTGDSLLVLAGQMRAITSLAFSPDGTRLAAAGDDSGVRLWDAASGQQLQSLPGHAGAIWAVAYSKDGKLLATAGFDRTILLWDAATGRQLRVLTGHTDAIYGIAFSPDGRFLASAGTTTPLESFSSPDARGGEIKLWDVDKGTEVFTFPDNVGTVHALAFSPDGNRLATGSSDRTVKLWDLATRREVRTLRGHHDLVTAVVFSPDGKLLATAGDDHTARLWDAETGEDVFLLRGHTESVTGLAFHPSGRRLATASADGTVRLWDLATGQEVFLLRGQQGPGPDRGSYHALAFSPDGTRLAAAYTGEDANHLLRHEVHVWSAALPAPVPVLRGHAGYIYALAYSRDGQSLVSTAADRTARVWDLTTGEERLTLDGRSEIMGIFVTEGNQGILPLVTSGCAVFSPDGAHVASAGPGQTLKVWEAATGKEVLSLPVHGELTSVAFSPDGTRLLASAGYLGGKGKNAPEAGILRGEVKVWEFPTGRERFAFAEPYPWAAAATLLGWGAAPDGQGFLANISGVLPSAGSSYSAVAFSPDGTRFAYATGSHEMAESPGIIRVRDAEGQQVFTLQGQPGGILGLAFTPDSKYLAAVAGGVRFWDLSTGKEVEKLPRELALHVHCLAFSPDGRYLALGGESEPSGQVVLWDLVAGRRVATLEDGRYSFTVTCVAFSPDGKHLAAGNGMASQISRRSEMRIWDISDVLQEGH